MRRKIYFDNTIFSLVLLLVLVRDVNFLLAVMGGLVACCWVVGDV